MGHNPPIAAPDFQSLFPGNASLKTPVLWANWGWVTTLDTERYGREARKVEHPLSVKSDYYGDSASAFMASSASLKRFVRRARASAFAWSVPSGP